SNVTGTVTVTVQLHDNGGTANGGADTSGAQTFTITLTNRDTTPPVLMLPGNITAQATGPHGASVMFNATAYDAGDRPLPVLCLPFPGLTFPLGTTTVYCGTMDRHYNVALGTFTVTVVDTTAPTIASVTPSRTTLSPPNHSMVPVSLTVAV